MFGFLSKSTENPPAEKEAERSRWRRVDETQILRKGYADLLEVSETLWDKEKGPGAERKEHRKW